MRASYLILPYHKTIFKTNIILSLLLSILSFLLMPPASSYPLVYFCLLCFIIWIMTGGFLLSVLYFEISRKNECYFYYNLGISKLKLILLTYFLHVVFIIPLLFILNYA
jgi:hypothetical protein